MKKHEHGRVITFQLRCSYCENRFEHHLLTKKLVGELTAHSCPTCEEEHKFRKKLFTDTFQAIFQTSGSIK